MRGLLASVSILLVAATPFAAFADGTMTQINSDNPGAYYHGTVTDIASTGLNTWQGNWHNNHGQTHTLVYKFDPTTNSVEVDELESKQTYLGKCSITTTTLSCSGQEAVQKNISFDSVITLP